MTDQKITKQNAGALGIAGIYLLISSLWILLSDRFVEAIASDRDTQMTLSTLKGWGFVTVTALLLYWLIQRYTISLRESEERIAGILNSAMDAVLSIDNSNRIVLFNPAAEKMFGYTADEIMGQSLDILIPEFHRAEHRRQIDNFGQTGITNRHMNGHKEIMGVKKGGDEFPIDTSISQVDVDGGKQFTAILRDVSEHKRAEESLRKIHDELEVQFQQRTTALSEANALLETMLEYIPDQIYFKDAESRFIKNSKAQAMALGLSDPSLVAGKTDFDFFPHAQRSFDEEQEIIRTGKPLVDFEEEVIWPDGNETWVSTTKVPLRSQEGKIIGTFGISRDITERKQAEESLRKANEELEVKVAERTTELSKANQQLQLELRERKQAEEALITSETSYRRLFEAAKDGILILDADTGEIKDVNAFLKELLGYPLSGFLGKQLWELGLFKDIVANKESFQELKKKEYIRYENLPLKTADGRTIWVEFVSNVYKVGDRKVVQCNIRDITERKQAETALQKSELIFRSFLEQSEDAILMANDKGEVIQWSRGAEKLTGFPRDETIGRLVWDVQFRSAPDEYQSKENYEHIKASLQTVLSTGQGVILNRLSEAALKRADGTLITAQTLAFSIQTDTGFLLGNIMRDMTKRKQAEQEIQRLNETLEQRIVERTAELSDLYNNAPCGYHSLNAEGVLVHINDTELNWLGYKREELIGKVNMTSLLTPASVEIFNRKIPLFKENGWLNDLELELVRKDGSILPILLNATAVRDSAGGYVESRTTLVDYTERKRIEDDVLKSKTQLEATNRELEAFSYSVSHDLRSPLRGIDGWSMALLEDYGPMLDEQGLAHIQKVRAEAQRMGTLIDDILQLSRITRADMNKEKVDLSAIAETVAARLQETKPDDRQVDFVIQKGLTALGDPKLLEVVLTNLLGNAFKFTSKKQEARIEFGQTIVESEPAFFVCDNGAGFDMIHANKLFGAFQRMHRASEFPGTGVGLATVQRVINRHGGSIWASSEVGRGATFYFTLEDNNK